MKCSTTYKHTDHVTVHETNLALTNVSCYSNRNEILGLKIPSSVFTSFTTGNR
ncbi:hypothetical protein X975_04187, partial [Stegodyphus mimosarum]